MPSTADSGDIVMSKVSLVNEKNLGEILEEVEYSDVATLAAIASTETWAPGTFEENKRTIKTFKQIELLVLDIDGDCTLEVAKEKFNGFQHIIATSRNHQKEKQGITCDRFRVILWLSDILTTDRDFKATWDRAKRLWPFIDSACKDSSRFFYASPGIVSVAATGRRFDVSLAMDTIDASRELDRDLSPRDQAASIKGDLWKSTYKFLAEGAGPGTRHTSLVSAVGNMREQGYTQPEVIERLEAMILAGGDWTQESLSTVDLKTVERMFNRDMKYPNFNPPLQSKEQNQNLSNGVVNANDLLDEMFAYLSDKDKVAGEPTGLEGLDKLLGGGFRTGEITVLMAQAKTGKNTLYHDLIYKHLSRGLAFGYASRELNPATEVVPNLLSIALGVNAWKASIDDTFQTKARQAVSRWELFFAPGYGYFSMQEIEQWFRSLRDLGVTHYLFDHFHYALESEDYEATARLIKGLKTLTKELDIHLSLIVQPRALREGESLSLATLRGGAAIGQALDNLLILERVKGQDNISKLTLEVARHKLAKLGSVYLQYNAETTAFVEVDKQLIVEPPALTPRGINPRGFSRFEQA